VRRLLARARPHRDRAARREDGRHRGSGRAPSRSVRRYSRTRAGPT